ncbi:MAG: delta-60 repeat domain-containing protein, partial [Limisphaerales bacterium]
MRRKLLAGFFAFLFITCWVQASTNTIDFTFNPGTGTDMLAEAVAVQPDGKIIIAGAFRNYNGTPRNFIARLHKNGTLDQTFVANPNDWVRCVAVQPNGKILIGGKFTFVDGVPRNRIARLNADGSLDQTFDPGTGVEEPFFYWLQDDIPSLFTIALQNDGKILIGGGFRTYNGTPR